MAIVSRLFHLSCFSHLFSYDFALLVGFLWKVIVALIFLFPGSIQVVCASVLCFLFEELIGFCAFLLRPFPRMNLLIIKPWIK